MSVTAFSYPANLVVTKDLDLDATSEQIGSGAETLFAAEMDNSQNTTSSFVKFHNLAAPVIGTTVPIIVVRIPAGAKVPMFCSDTSVGRSFGTALAVVAVTTGGVGGTTPPTNSVLATVLSS